MSSLFLFSKILLRAFKNTWKLEPFLIFISFFTRTKLHYMVSLIISNSVYSYIRHFLPCWFSNDLGYKYFKIGLIVSLIFWWSRLLLSQKIPIISLILQWSRLFWSQKSPIISLIFLWSRLLVYQKNPIDSIIRMISFSNSR